MTNPVSAEQISRVNARLQTLTPNSVGQWGTMTPGEMVAHLTDALRVPLGVVPPPAARASWLQRAIVRPLVLSILPRYPKGAKARAEVDPRKLGTKPGEFARDVAQLLEMNTRFVAAAPSIRVEHPRFGPLTAQEWVRWWWMHSDHHLRQFGA